MIQFFGLCRHGNIRCIIVVIIVVLFFLRRRTMTTTATGCYFQQYLFNSFYRIRIGMMIGYRTLAVPIRMDNTRSSCCGHLPFLNNLMGYRLNLLLIPCHNGIGSIMTIVFFFCFCSVVVIIPQVYLLLGFFPRLC